MTLSITTLNIMALSVRALNIMALIMIGLIARHIGNNSEHNDIQLLVSLYLVSFGHVSDFSLNAMTLNVSVRIVVAPQRLSLSCIRLLVLVFNFD